MKTFLRLLTYFLRYKSRIIGGLISVAVMSLSDTAGAFLIARLVNVLQQISDLVRRGEEILVEVPFEALGRMLYSINIRGYDESFQLIVTFAIAIVVLIIVKVVFVYIREYLMSSVQQKILMRFRIELFDTVLVLPVRYFDSEKTGRIMSRITNDVNALEQSLYLMVEIAQNVVYTLIFATALLYTNWQLTLFTIFIFAISGIISRKFGDRIRTHSHFLTNTLADISSFLQEKINAIRIVKSFTREEHERQSFRKKVETNYHHSMKIVRTMAYLSPTNELFNTTVTSLLVVFTGYLFIQGSMTIEAMVYFLLLMISLAKPVKALGEGVARLQKTLVSAQYIFELLDLEKEKLTTAAPRVEIRRGDVEFRSVSFSYAPEIPALENVSFSVRGGEKIALVGPSGSGKTTLINLIPRFYNPTSGGILIDWIDTSVMSLLDLRSQIGIVPQDVMLFSGTVLDNIRYGRLEATEGEVKEAAKQANSHEFIQRFERGYDTEVGERGVQLSGGQRQRIAIARAILRNPKILLLDEATSALDSESEQMVQEALGRLMQGRTTFIIAHRLSTIQHCDRIFVLERGKLIEQGKHEELLRNGNGLYKRLYSLQFQDEPEAARET
ncbi:MAG: ABC transporter ATP-binding protein/permease [Ignavibacteriae bacterium]|nr:ABC transporter ATP-binding protein/permease [Ignavibacteriota bacterium]